jgi:hypothetical protein
LELTSAWATPQSRWAPAPRDHPALIPIARATGPASGSGVLTRRSPDLALQPDHRRPPTASAGRCAPPAQERRFARYGHHVVANMCGDLPLNVSVDDRPCEAHSTYDWSGGGTVLTIATVLPDRGLAAELISTYVGHASTPTVATHVMLGPVGQENDITTVEHEHLSPAENARECAYDHAHQMIDKLRAAGREVSVQLDEMSFAELERVE